MALIKWRQEQNNPLKEWMDFEQPFLGFLPSTFQGLKEAWAMAMDVSEDESNVIVKADLPGLKKEEIKISLEDNILTIRGERKAEEEKKDRNYHRIERSYGTFERSMDLDVAVDESKIKATYQDGVLEIVLPRKEKTHSRQIEIKPE